MMTYKYLRAVQENGPDYFLIYEGVKVFGASPIARCDKEEEAKRIVGALNFYAQEGEKMNKLKWTVTPDQRVNNGYLIWDKDGNLHEDASQEERAAISALLTLAPELLDAVKEALDCLNGESNKGYEPDVLRKFYSELIDRAENRLQS